MEHKKTGYTPGPWKVVGSEIWGPRFRLADGRGAYDEKDREKRNANAALIAAAPELLSALEIMACNFERQHPGDYESWDTYRWARAAIAKAKGEA